MAWPQAKGTTGDADVEYYLEAVAARQGRALWPPTAPALNQTVVRMP